jgi:hypothetical protein
MLHPEMLLSLEPTDDKCEAVIQEAGFGTAYRVGPSVLIKTTPKAVGWNDGLGGIRVALIN